MSSTEEVKDRLRFGGSPGGSVVEMAAKGRARKEARDRFEDMTIEEIDAALEALGVTITQEATRAFKETTLVNLEVDGKAPQRPVAEWVEAAAPSVEPEAPQAENEPEGLATTESEDLNASDLIIDEGLGEISDRLNGPDATEEDLGEVAAANEEPPEDPEDVYARLFEETYGDAETFEATLALMAKGGVPLPEGVRQATGRDGFRTTNRIKDEAEVRGEIVDLDGKAPKKGATRTTLVRNLKKARAEWLRKALVASLRAVVFGDESREQPVEAPDETAPESVSWYRVVHAGKDCEVEAENAHDAILIGSELLDEPVGNCTAERINWPSDDEATPDPAPVLGVSPEAVPPERLSATDLIAQVRALAPEWLDQRDEAPSRTELEAKLAELRAGFVAEQATVPPAPEEPEPPKAVRDELEEARTVAFEIGELNVELLRVREEGKDLRKKIDRKVARLVEIHTSMDLGQFGFGF